MSKMKSFAQYSEMRNESAPIIKAFSDKLYNEKSGYAYVAGYYESLIGELLTEVPKATRARILNELKEKVA